MAAAAAISGAAMALEMLLEIVVPFRVCCTGAWCCCWESCCCEKCSGAWWAVCTWCAPNCCSCSCRCCSRMGKSAACCGSRSCCCCSSCWDGGALTLRRPASATPSGGQRCRCRKPRRTAEILVADVGEILGRSMLAGDQSLLGVAANVMQRASELEDLNRYFLSHTIHTQLLRISLLKPVRPTPCIVAANRHSAAACCAALELRPSTDGGCRDG